MATCPRCEGNKKITCPSCDGKGNKYFVPVLDFWEYDCTDCYGAGYVACPECEGRGEVLQLVPPHVICVPREASARL